MVSMFNWLMMKCLIGMVSMVNDGNGFHGSQFLLTLADNLDSLDGIHTVFGEVVEGKK